MGINAADTRLRQAQPERGSGARFMQTRESAGWTISYFAESDATSFPAKKVFALVKWRTRHDSNVWPLPSEGNALSS